ncbi:hypothetical protein SO802_010174 [Lithocarpus litseifolius]|uniref:Gag protein n=1 Tax=Lithocarpus litseifolius TaxID=425828 RepID=A0AAW2DFS6_9ROSI
MQIHYQLATLKKGNSSIGDYFHQFTTLVDTLAAIDQPLNDFKLISFLLAGLGLDYDSFVTLVTAKVDPLFIEELYGHLLAHEIHLEQQQPAVDLTIVGANFARANFAGQGNARGCCGGKYNSSSSRGTSSSPNLCRI